MMCRKTLYEMKLCLQLTFATPHFISHSCISVGPQCVVYLQRASKPPLQAADIELIFQLFLRRAPVPKGSLWDLAFVIRCAAATG
jgi:hypothetical protein